MKRSVALLALLLLIASFTQPTFATQNLTTQGNCSSSVKRNTLSTITEQKKALAREDFNTAIAFSSASFRSAVSVANFTQIIQRSYSFLIYSKSLQVTECQQADQLVRLVVKVIDTSNKNYELIYVLQSQNKKELIAPNRTGYGISSAQLNITQPQL